MELSRQRGLCLAVALVVLALDQLTKWWVASNILLWSGRIEVIPGLFDLVHYHNRGAAFGFLSTAEGGWGTMLFTGIALCASVVLLWGMLREKGLMPGGGLRMRLGLGLILGGTVGNLVDRVRQGAVTDFLDVYVNDWHWPAFNVADSAISVGCVGLILLVLRTPHPVEPTAIADKK